ncbi:DUF4304 domain-containing protein [Marilutibacter aestuarii]
MKPLGFTKDRATFSRQHPSHTERFNIQPSMFNNPYQRTFFVNCMLLFNDLPEPYQFRHKHKDWDWDQRIERIVPDAPSPWFEYSHQDDPAVIVSVLSRCILQASETLSSEICGYMRKYIAQTDLALAERSQKEA